MKPKLFRLVLLTTMLLGATVLAQTPPETLNKKARTPEDYTVRTLKEIASHGSMLATENSAAESATFLNGDLAPSRVRVTYRGTSRPLAANKKKLIAEWAARYAGNPGYYTLPFTNEVRFREAGVDHWLVVKKSDLPDLKRQFKKGAAIDLYLLRLGGLKNGNEWEWVLLVEKFARRRQ